MKTYCRKFAKSAIRNFMSTKKETRDGILWYVDVVNKTCRIKIQGSNKLITAHYPRNQKRNPSWLRIGNSVRVVHREGIRGFLEVVGEGRAIPSPVTGDNFPDIGGLSDGIMSGMVMYATDPTRNGVFVTSGTYRIDSTIYDFVGWTGDYIVMNDPAPMVMGIIPTLKMGIIILEVDAAPIDDSLFRYDAYVVGIDGIPDYIKGTEVASDPVKPTIPSDHILIRYILRVGGDVTVTDDRIGINYSTPKPVNLSLTIPADMAFGTLEVDLRVDIKDQYDNNISSDAGWILTLSKIIGTGQVWSLDTGYDDDTVTQQLVGSTRYTFRYKRNTLVVETSPYFQFTLSSKPNLHGFDSLVLLDAGGNPI